MAKTFPRAVDPNDLRSRAVSHRSGPESHARLDAGAAVRALYELASAPATAPNALALLHELQAHQVELDLQTEELHRMQAELEISLQRQMQLYEYAPVGYWTVDVTAVVRELN